MNGSRFAAVAGAIAWRGIRHARATPSILVPMLLFPLFLFAALAGGLSAVEDVPGFDFAGNYAAFQFVFVLLQAAAAGGAAAGIPVAIDFQTGFARRFLLAAPNRGALVAGYVLVALQYALVVWVVLAAAGLLAGMTVDGSGLDLFGLLALAVLVNVASTLLAAGIALRVRSLQAGPLMQMPLLVIFFVAPAMVPIELLQGWVAAVAEVNPVTALLEAGRGMISGRPESVGLAFAIGLAAVALAALWARGGLRRAEAAP